MKPTSELKSTFNTSPGEHDFDLYDDRTNLGNQGKPDGARFKGRGFFQLTGPFQLPETSRSNWLRQPVAEEPDLTNEPGITSKFLASFKEGLVARFIKDKEPRIRSALEGNYLAKTRKLVNGGTHGLERFSETYRKGGGSGCGGFGAPRA